MSNSMKPSRTARGLVLVGALVACVLASAPALNAQTAQGQLAKLLAGFKRPHDTPSPADNPTTPQKVRLGKALFFDPRLSASGAIACASCHNPGLGWQDGLATGVGHGGARLTRRTPTILDAAWVEPLFWDGRAGTLEEQAKGPLAAVGEMNMPHADVVRTVRGRAGYRAMFAEAFPGGEIDIDSVARAIAAYERTVVSGQAPFDRWVEGDDSAVDPAAKRGFAVFTVRGRCAACHGGWRLTDDGFHDIGLPGDDPGRGGLMPNLPVARKAFKTPTLRNIAERAPYMHDGSLATLEQVIDHYDNGFVRRASLSHEMKPLKLTAQEKADLLAFLRTLSGPEATVTLPVLPQ